VRGIRPNIVFFGEPAPEYAGMWQAFHDLQPHDAVVIIGTSGTVLPVNTMVAGHKARGGLAVLNNLHRQPEITERLFTHVFHEPATQTVEKIDAILRERFAS
jgi:NAD-dependent deacetylase